MIQLFFAAKWILISEVTFESGEKVCFSKLEPQVIFSGTLVLGRWEMHDEKPVSINTLLSYSRQQGRHEDKRLHTVTHCPVSFKGFPWHTEGQITPGKAAAYFPEI